MNHIPLPREGFPLAEGEIGYIFKRQRTNWIGLAEWEQEVCLRMKVAGEDSASRLLWLIISNRISLNRNPCWFRI